MVEGIVFRPNLARILPAFLYQRCTGMAPLFAGGPISIEKVPELPLPGPRWARVRCHLAGICGTDLNLLRLQFSMRSASMARKRSRKQPLWLGHEAVGRVVEIGPDVRSLQVGERVLLVPGVSCAAMERSPVCEMCVHGWPLLCLHRDDPHPGEGGGWSEQFVRHESQLMRIPDDITDEQAVLLDPLGSAAHAVLRRPPVAHERVIVIGCGAIGLSMILSLRALATEVKIIALARHPFQAEHARAMGADEVLSGEARELYQQLAQALGTDVLAAGRKNQLLHHGADVVYDAVGNGESLHHALRWTRPRGTVVVEGINPHPATLDRSAIWLRELEILGAHGHGREDYQGKDLYTIELVLEWIREKRINPDALITHRFPWREYRRAIRIAEGKARSSATKVIFELSPDG